MSPVLANRLDPLRKERLLLVAPLAIDESMGRSIADRFTDHHVSTCDTYLSAVSDLVRSPAGTIIACVDPRLRQMDNAVAGLRRAAGAGVRLVLVCRPETEAIARSLLDKGADEYVLHPLQSGELDAAIRRAPSDVPIEPGSSDSPVASMEELARLGEVLAHLGDPPHELLQRVAEMIRAALGARRVTVAVQGTAASVGESNRRPVLTAALHGVAGCISICERDEGTYLTSDAARLEHYAKVIGPIVQAAARQRQLHRLAMTDECSGLPNRRYLHERLAEILERAAAQRYPVTMLLFDIDDFKTYNDEHGHAIGDDIIRRIGEMFLRHCREHDVVTRYGGDEFAVVFWDPHGPRVPGSKHPDCALSVLQRIREALRLEKLEGLGDVKQGQLTISGGLATFPWDASNAKALIRQADAALLEAKRAGKNQVLVIGAQR